MRIWVDADACPVVVKEILFRAAGRTGVELTLVANQPLSTPPAPNIRSMQVPRGFDADAVAAYPLLVKARPVAGAAAADGPDGGHRGRLRHGREPGRTTSSP